MLEARRLTKQFGGLTVVRGRTGAAPPSRGGLVAARDVEVVRGTLGQRAEVLGAVALVLRGSGSSLLGHAGART